MVDSFSEYSVMLNLTRTIIVLFLLFQFCPTGMAKKRIAGLVIYRTLDQGITEYLMLKPSKDEKDWSPPKGT